MKLHHTKYKENYKKYILSTIETGINDEPLKTDQEKIEYLFKRFNLIILFIIVIHIYYHVFLIFMLKRYNLNSARPIINILQFFFSKFLENAINVPLLLLDP